MTPSIFFNNANEFIGKQLNKIIIIFAIFIYIFTLVNMPLSPGDFYEPHHTANLFLPGFGFDSPFSTQPFAYPTLMFKYIYSDMLLKFFSDNIMVYTQIGVYIDIILSVSVFSLISFFFIKDRQLSMLLGLLLGFTSSFKGLYIVFLLLPLYFQLKYIYSQNNKTKFFLLFLSTYIIGTFVWHSLSIAIFLVCICTFIMLIVQNFDFNQTVGLRNVNYSVMLLYTAILCSLITAVSWIYLRIDKFFSLLGHEEISNMFFDMSYILKIGLQKGSDVNSQFMYGFNGIFPMVFFDYIRYIVYFIIYLYIFIIALRIIYFKLKPTLLENLLIGAVIADLLLKIFYFFSTRTLTVVIINNILMPLFILYLFINIFETNLRGKLSFQIHGKKVLMVGIAFLIFIALLVTTVNTAYISKTQYPSGATEFASYENSINWFVHNGKNEETTVIADADTGGYWQILYSKGLFNECRLNIVTITTNRYYSILNNDIIGSYNMIYLYNNDIFDKNLALFSLEGWEKFKPISKYEYDQDNLQLIYNDNHVLIYSNG